MGILTPDGAAIIPAHATSAPERACWRRRRRVRRANVIELELALTSMDICRVTCVYRNRYIHV